MNCPMAIKSIATCFNASFFSLLFIIPLHGSVYEPIFWMVMVLLNITNIQIANCQQIDFIIWFTFGPSDFFLPHFECIRMCVFPIFFSFYLGTREHSWNRWKKKILITFENIFRTQWRRLCWIHAFMNWSVQLQKCCSNSRCEHFFCCYCKKLCFILNEIVLSIDHFE